MISVLAAAALAAAPLQQAAADDPDVRCYAAVTMSLVGLKESGKLDAATETGLTAIIWYYYGRMETRLPGVDFAAAMAQMISRPGYLTRELAADGERCGKEAEAKGNDMQKMGDRMQQLSQQMDQRAG
jgi:hypothetical protein